MIETINIDLRGLVFSSSGRQVCAVCAKDFDKLSDEEREEDEDALPLLLWTTDCKRMLCLCWKCATPRLSQSGQFEGSE